MTQQHLEAYLQLAQQLLICPHGEEWTLLERNEQLVTPEFVKLLEHLAVQMAGEGKADASKYLQHWSKQINHLFEEAVHHQSTDEKSRAYLKLVQALLDCPSGSEVDILAANEHLIDASLVKMMKQVAAQMATRDEAEAARFLSNLAAEIGRNLVPVDNFKANLQKDVSLTGLDNNHFVNFEKFNQPVAIPQENPDTVEKEPTLDNSTKQWIDESLAEIAESLRNLEDIVFSRLQPSNPLWYMDILERAQANAWVLTTEEVEDLIGVKPRCEAGKSSYQRGCWMFLKAGKMGSQTGWRVIKENVEIPSEV
ncbi:hypothetical protein [Rivularia sp. PCC 7116]|uniref:hypothetical protein n=1 Tax=Rivularia sp. PCC 7116 TaxID=373994 RepID=UPI0005C7A8B9|nr:hypothetical protein [Rivularia sp. PCC 7116]